MQQVGKVDYFDGNKRLLYFFVEGDVEEEGFYKVERNDKIFYIFVTGLSEVPLDKEMRARYSKHDYSFDSEERFVLYAQASILQEYRKETKRNIIGYKTIPQHNDCVFLLEEIDFNILGLPKLDFAHVRSGSKKLESKVGFSKEAYTTHWLLCGWTSSGKTNAAKVLLNVTLKGDGEPFAGGVIIDPHGEYYESLKHFNTKENVVVSNYTVGAGQDPNEHELEVSWQNVYPSYLTDVFGFREDTQLNFMNKCCNDKRGGWIKFVVENDVNTIVNGLYGSEKPTGIEMIVGAAKHKIAGAFREDDVWIAEPNSFVSTITKGVSKGKWYVIDVSAVGNKTTKLITGLLSRAIFRKYKNARTKRKEEWEKYKPAGILVEEAHNFLSPEESSRGNVIAKIAKEGRKFKVFSIVVEQDPGGIDQRILKQIHNKIILQLIPVDAKAICDTTPYVKELEKKIPSYSVGEGLFVSTGSFNFALPVKFPVIGDWIQSNSKECEVCKNPTLSPTRVCIVCEEKQRKNDAKTFISK